MRSTEDYEGLQLPQASFGDASNAFEPDSDVSACPIVVMFLTGAELLTVTQHSAERRRQPPPDDDADVLHLPSEAAEGDADPIARASPKKTSMRNSEQRGILSTPVLPDHKRIATAMATASLVTGRAPTVSNSCDTVYNHGSCRPITAVLKAASRLVLDADTSDVSEKRTMDSARRKALPRKWTPCSVVDAADKHSFDEIDNSDSDEEEEEKKCAFTPTTLKQAWWKTHTQRNIHVQHHLEREEKQQRQQQLRRSPPCAGAQQMIQELDKASHSFESRIAALTSKLVAIDGSRARPCDALSEVGIDVALVAPAMKYTLDAMLARVKKVEAECRAAIDTVQTINDAVADHLKASLKPVAGQGATTTKVQPSADLAAAGNFSVKPSIGAYREKMMRRKAAAKAVDLIEQTAAVERADDEGDVQGIDESKNDDEDTPIQGSFRFNAQSKHAQPLRDWLLNHFDFPYPEDEEKCALAAASGMTREQVGNWFINARVRIWRPMIISLGDELESQGGLEAAKGKGGSKSKR